MSTSLSFRPCSKPLVSGSSTFCWLLDRLSREGVLETLQHLNRLTSYGVNYRSFTEQYFDSCGIFKDAVISILATIARQERIRISERVRAGLRNARAKGKTLGRPRVIVDAGRISRLRAQGRSVRQIAAELGYSRGLVHNTLANSKSFCVADAAD
jgi:DNA invertase Pin-like site-specific DNA recombinase